MLTVTQHNFYWFLIGYVVAAYVIDWVADRIWFMYLDWRLAHAERLNRKLRVDDRTRLTAKGLARHRRSMPRTGRAIGDISAPGRARR